MLTPLDSFEVNGERGFLPKLDPLDRLPEEFSHWEDIGRELPKLLLTGKVRSFIKQLPLLNAARLGDDRERKRAMAILSFLGHAYVWGENDLVESLPPSLSAPWHRVAQMLGRPPVLSYASYALGNWRRIDLKGPIELGNIALLQNFLGGQDEEWFVLIHVAIEAAAAAALGAIVAAQGAAANEEPERVADQLAVIVQAIEAMNQILLRMPERCAPYIYFNRVRPYIHGWADQPSLPSGIVTKVWRNTAAGRRSFAAKPARRARLFRSSTPPSVSPTPPTGYAAI